MNAVDLTRIGIFLCGLMGITLTACIVVPGSTERIALAFNADQYYTQLPVIVSLLVAPTISICVSLYLVLKSNSIAHRLFLDTKSTPNQIELAMYRVALTAVAILIFTDTLPNLLNAIGIVIIDQHVLAPDYRLELSFTLYRVPYFVAFAIQISIASYLLFGAPHLVNWQIARSREWENSGSWRFHISHLLILLTMAAIIVWFASYL